MNISLDLIYWIIPVVLGTSLLVCLTGYMSVLWAARSVKKRAARDSLSESERRALYSSTISTDALTHVQQAFLSLPATFLLCMIASVILWLVTPMNSQWIYKQLLAIIGLTLFVTYAVYRIMVMKLFFRLNAEMEFYRTFTASLKSVGGKLLLLIILCAALYWFISL